jgi:hypothetical protein
MGSTLQRVYPTGVPVSFEAPAMDSAPPRPIYFVLLPAVLTVGGVLSWIISGDLGLLLGCVIATIIGLFTLWEWLFRHAPTRISTMLAMSLLLGYGSGALNTWLTLPRGNLTVGQYIGIGKGALAHGMAAVLLSTVLLYFLGEIVERPLFRPGYQLQITDSTRSLIYFGLVAVLAGYATHSLVFEGVASAGGRASIPGMFIIWLSTPITALAVAAFLTADRGRQRLFAGLSALLLLGMLAVRGRRGTVYTAVEILFVLGLAGYRWRGKGIRNAVLLAFLGSVVVTTSLVFVLLRIAPVNQAGRTMPTLAQKAAGAEELYKQGGAFALAAQATRKNVETRTLVLSFLSSILEATSTKTPAHGRDTLGMIQLAIPRVIDPQKNAFFSEEELVDQQFGFGFGDQPNSILTAGATDFGLAGVIIYPILVVVAVRIAFAFASVVLKPLPLLMVSLDFVLLFLQTEVPLSAYLVEIRDAILFGLVVQLFLSLPRLKFSGQHSPHGGW